jgi:thymidylate synthase
LHIGTFENFTNCYLALIEKVTNGYTYESAPRGQKIKEIIGATFTITDPKARLPYVVGRKFGVTYLAAELVWYLSGNNKTNWISKYSNFWSSISDDGVTANSAYGARLFQPHQRIASARFTQWDYIVGELKRDPDSRRAVMHLRVPADSIDAKLDVPCTLALQFFIRDNKLHQVAHMRSSDVIFGIAYDIPAFTMFQEILANELNVEMGTYTHVSNSLHLYERHFDMAQKILEPENIASSRSWARSSRDTIATFGSHTLDEIRSGPVYDLVELESKLDLCQNSAEILELVDVFNWESGWKEFAVIFACKRLRELGDKNQSRELMNKGLGRCYNFYLRRAT